MQRLSKNKIFTSFVAITTILGTVFSFGLGALPAPVNAAVTVTTAESWVMPGMMMGAGMNMPVVGFKITASASETINSIAVKFEDVSSSGATPSAVLAAFGEAGPLGATANQGIIVVKDANSNGWYDPTDTILAWENQPSWSGESSPYTATLDIANTVLPATLTGSFNYFIVIKAKSDVPAAKMFKLTFDNNAITTSGSSPTITGFSTATILTMGGGDGTFSAGPKVTGVDYISPTTLRINFDKDLSSGSTDCTETCAATYTLTTSNTDDTSTVTSAAITASPNGVLVDSIMVVASSAVMKPGQFDFLTITSGKIKDATDMYYTDNYPLYPQMQSHSVKISEIQLATQGTVPIANDDFVELYNSGAAAAVLTGVWKVIINCGVSGSETVNLPENLSIPAGGFYLLANNASQYHMAANKTYDQNIDNGCYVALIDASTPANYYDLVGIGSSAAVYEGSPVANIANGSSVERKAKSSSTASSMSAVGPGADASLGNSYDSNNNLFDFVVRASGSPQASGSTPESLGVSGTNNSPTIEHMPLVNAVANQEIRIPAKIMDVEDSFSALATKSLCYKAGNAAWGDIPTCVTGQMIYDVIFTIPASAVTTAGVDYYIKVTDSAGNTTYSGTVAVPYRINVSSTQGSRRVSGTVYQSNCSTPIVNSNVYLDGTGYSATTDASGVFTLNNVPDGVYVLRAAAGGYLDSNIWGVSVNSNMPNSSGWQFCLQSGSAGIGGDMTGAHVMWTAPGEGMSAAPTNIALTSAPIVITLDAAIDESTVTTSNVLLKKFSSGSAATVVGYSVGVDTGSGIQGQAMGGSISQPMIAVYSNTPLETGFSYIVEITPAVKTSSGNPVVGSRPGGGHELMFTTSATNAGSFGGNFGFIQGEEQYMGGGNFWTTMQQDTSYQTMAEKFDATSGKWEGGAYNPPYIFGSVPAAGAWNVNINSAIIFTFSEALDSNTVNRGTFELYSVNGSGVETNVTETAISSVSLDTAKTKVTMNLSGSLTASTQYRVKVKNAVRSSSGISLGNPTNPGGAFFMSDFTTGTGTDATAPTITGSWPADAATGVGFDFGFIDIGYSEPLQNVSNSTVKLLFGANEVPSTVEFDAMKQSLRIFPTVALMPGAKYTISLTYGGTSGIKDLAGNPSQASTATRTFTMTTTTDTTAPRLEMSNCDDFSCAITFSKQMNSAKVTDTARFATSALKPSNYTITHGVAGITAYEIPAGASFTWSHETNTVIIKGLNISGLYNIAVGAGVTDQLGNAIDSSYKTTSGSVRNSANTMGFIGPGGGGMMGPPPTNGVMGTASGPTGFGGFQPSEAMMMGATVRPMNSMAGATTTYFVDFPIAPSGSGANKLGNGSYIKLTFPKGFNLSSVIPDPNNPSKTDLNWQGSGVVTLKTSGVNDDGSGAATKGGAADDGLTVSGQTVTVWLSNTGTTSEPDMLHFELKNIVNNSIPKDFNTEGYTVDMKSYDSSNKLIESKTSMPINIMPAGTSSLAVTVNAADGTGAMTLMMGSPKTGPMDATLNIAGGTATQTWSNLPDDCYHIFTEPTITLGETKYSGQMSPEPICVSGATTKTITLTKLGLGNTAQLAVKITGSFSESGESVDIFANGPRSYVETKTLTGSVTNDSTTLYLSADGNYMISFGPAIPKGPMMGPVSMPDWMPPMPINVEVSGLAGGGGATIKRVDTNETVTNLSFSINAATKQIVGRVVSAATTTASSYSANATTLSLTSGSNFAVSDYIVVTDGTNTSSSQISSISGTTITLTSVMSNSFAAGSKVYNVISDAELWATQPMGFGGSGSHAKSNSDGSFVLKVADNGTYDVGAFKSGLGDSPPRGVTVSTNNLATNDGNSTADVKFDGQMVTTSNALLIKIFKPRYTISGKISDSSGNPLTYAHVMAENATTNQMTHSSTDSSGNYVLWVDTGSWTIKADMPPGTNTCGAITGTATVTDANIANKNIQPSSGTCYSIGGTVTIAGAVQPNVPIMVSAWDSANNRPAGTYNRFENTNSSGVYSIKAGAGTYRVSMWSPDYGEIGQDVTVTNGNQTADITYEANAMKTLTVVFTGGTSTMNGFIEAKATIGSMRRGMPVNDLSVNKTMSLPSGTYNLFVDVRGIGNVSPASAVVLTTDQTVTINLSSSTMRTVSGTVLDENGSAVGGAAVVLVNETTGLTNKTTTDASGGYSLKIKDGTYSVKAEHKDYSAPTKATLAVAANTTYDFDPDDSNNMTEKTLTISGIAYQSDGTTAMTSGVVWGSMSTGEFSKTAIQSDGTYSLPVSAGTWTLKADGPLYAETTFSATVTVAQAAVTGRNVTLTADANDLKGKGTATVTPSIGASVNDQQNTGVTFNAGNDVLGRDSNPGSMTFEEVDMPDTDIWKTMGNFVDISAKDSNGTDLNRLNGNGAEIVFTYTAAELAADGVTDETMLKLTYYDETTGTYMPFDSQTIDTVNNTITGYIDHLTVVGVTHPPIVAATTGRNSSSTTGSTVAPVVTVVVPEVKVISGTTTVSLSTTGTVVNLGSGATMAFPVAASSHSLVISGINIAAGTASVTISSNPIKLDLKVNEPQQVDVDGDGVKDIEVTLQQLVSDTEIKLLVKQLEVATVKKDETKTDDVVIDTKKDVEDVVVQAEDPTPAKPEVQIIAKEKEAIKNFRSLIKKNPALDSEWRVIYYLAYGSIAKTKTMTAKERLSVLTDYKEVFGKLPQTTVDWQDLANMVIGKKVSKKITARELEAIKAFVKIFKKQVQFSNKANDQFVQDVAYRLRPEVVDAAKEASALAVFKKAYGKAPNSGFLWAVLRAIAYSGMLEEVNKTTPVQTTQPNVSNAVPVMPARRVLSEEITAVGEYFRLIKRAPSGNYWKVVHFIAYGSTDLSKDKTLFERSAYVKQFKTKYKKLPLTTADWENLAKLIK